MGWLYHIIGLLKQVEIFQWSRYISFPTRAKLLNITMNRINHSVYLCSTRHLTLHRSLSHKKCCFVDVENVQHSGRQSSTSTIYLLGILPGDLLSDNTTSRTGKRKKLVFNICDDTFVSFGINERLHEIFILFRSLWLGELVLFSTTYIGLYGNASFVFTAESTLSIFCLHQTLSQNFDLPYFISLFSVIIAHGLDGSCFCCLKLSSAVFVKVSPELLGCSPEVGPRTTCIAL